MRTSELQLIFSTKPLNLKCPPWFLKQKSITHALTKYCPVCLQDTADSSLSFDV